MDALIRLAEAWLPLYAIHMAEVSLFILLVLAIDRWVKLDTRLKYALWLLALVKVFVPPFFALPLPEFLAASTEPVAPVTVTPQLYYVPDFEPEIVGPVPVEMPVPVSFYLFSLWVLSAVVLGGVTLWKNAVFQRALDVAVPVDLEGKLDAVNHTDKLKVYAKANLDSPLLVGVLKPRLYLPSKWTSWSSEQLRGVVAHELAHYVHRDIWALIFQAVATVLFGLNPLIWLLNRRLSYLRELRCDEAVLRHTELTPIEYGRLLFGFVDKSDRSVLNALYFTERGTSLKARFEHVINFKANAQRAKWQFGVPIFVALAIIPFSIREGYTQAPEMSQLIWRVDEVDEKPALTFSVAPTYPEDLKKAGVEGQVLMQFTVDAGGNVGDVQRLEGDSRFEDAAQNALRKYRWEPGKIEGEKKDVRLTQLVSFDLQGKDKRADDVYASLSAKSDSSKPKEAMGHEASVQDAKRTDALSPKIVSDSDIESRTHDVMDLSEVDYKPYAIRKVIPVYPESAKKMALEDKVLVKVLVDEKGKVGQASVLNGPEVFHQSAVNAVRAFRFRPAQHQGKSVSVWMTLPIHFRLPIEGKSSLKIDASEQDGAIAFLNAEVKPELLHSVIPAYPEEAEKYKAEMQIFLKVKVNVDGSVSDVSSGSARVAHADYEAGPIRDFVYLFRRFRKSAIDAVSLYRFKPALKEGKPVAVWMNLPVHFQLPPKSRQSSARQMGGLSRKLLPLSKAI